MPDTATAAKPTAAAKVDAENQKVATVPRQKPQLLAGNAGHAIVPQSVEACYRMAELVIKAGMAPKSINSVEKACVAILHGLEVGLTPMAALQSIAVINGSPSIWGDGILALIEASGLLEDMDETIDYDDKGEVLAATCMMKRVNRRQTIRTFTRPMAARAGLLKKEGPWQAYPHRMMQRRARWWCATDTFSDVLKGLNSAEERQDMIDVTDSGSATTAPPEPKRADFTEVATNGNGHSDEHDQETGEIVENKPRERPWKIADDIVGQEPRRKAILELLPKAQVKVDVDEIEEEHAEFIAKLGRLRAETQRAFDVRRGELPEKMEAE